jgi:hypothetical protein
MAQDVPPVKQVAPDRSDEPPVPQLADVPPEEWDYSNSQAFAGCGVIGAVVLAIVLPIILGLFMDRPWSQIIGFGVPGLLALVCVAIIAQMTRNKRAERRAGSIEEDPAEQGSNHP